MFSKLFSELHSQLTYIKTTHPSLPEVQIVFDNSIRFLDGGLSIGKKRESLLKRAIGEYVCYLDSDEDIAPNYIESLIRLCLSGADVCTFKAMVKLESYWAVVDMSLNYKLNDQLTPEYTVRRPPWPICPVKRKFAKLYDFADKNNAEDFEWMEKVLSHCTTEMHTNKILFCYQHGKHSEADQIPLP